MDAALGDLIKKVVWDEFIVEAAVSKVIAAVPFFAWGPMPVIVGFIVRRVGEFMYQEASNSLQEFSIEFTNEVRKKSVSKAVVTLKAIGASKGLDSKEFQNALENARKEFSSFNQYGHGIKLPGVQTS